MFKFTLSDVQDFSLLQCIPQNFLNKSLLLTKSLRERATSYMDRHTQRDRERGEKKLTCLHPSSVQYWHSRCASFFHFSLLSLCECLSARCSFFWGPILLGRILHETTHLEESLSFVFFFYFSVRLWKTKLIFILWVKCPQDKKLVVAVSLSFWVLIYIQFLVLKIPYILNSLLLYLKFLRYLFQNLWLFLMYGQYSDLVCHIAEMEVYPYIPKR